MEKKDLAACTWGFTLIELLVVIGILGILAVALLVAINPQQQLQKAQDSSLQSTSQEFEHAATGYFATHNAFPWDTKSNGGSDCFNGVNTFSDIKLTAFSNCINQLVADGDLKQSFLSVPILSKLYVSYVSQQPGSNPEVNVCYAPSSIAGQMDANTRFNPDGTLGTNCLSQRGTNACYWCTSGTTIASGATGQTGSSNQQSGGSTNSNNQPSATPTPPNPLQAVQWGLASSSFLNLQQANPQIAQEAFDGVQVYITSLSNQNAVPVNWSSIPTANYKSYAIEQSNPPLTANGIKVALYDPENWPQTPLNEQQHPFTSMTQFCSAVHVVNSQLKCIVTPARDLLLVSGSDCVKQNGETLDQAFIRCNIAGNAAQAGADIVSLQFQADEATPTTYASFINQAATQARAANPSVTVWAQLTTAISGSVQSSCTLYNAYTSIKNSVSGFWINVGSGGIEPQVGSNFLKDIIANGCSYSP